MNDDTVKLIRIPADTWRAVVEALIEGRHARREVLLSQSQGRPMDTSDHVYQQITTALELARKVSAE